MLFQIQARRTWRRALAVFTAGTALALAGCASSAPSAPPVPQVAPMETGPIELSVFWWGGDARAQLTHQVLALYTQKHPNVTFKETWQANAGYIDKLNTNLAAGSAADIFQLDDNMLGGVAARNQTIDLTNYIAAKRIDTAKLPGSLVDYGKVAGKQVAVPLAENTPGLVYDKTLIQSLGVEEPQIGWSWEKLISWATTVSQKTNYKTYGTMDPSADYKALWVWLRQHGKDLYDPTSTKLGFTESDLTQWFDLWKGARDAKAAPPADIIHVANAGDVTKQLVVTGQAATSFMWSNQMPELAKNTKDTLGVVSYPGDPKAQWARAALYFAGYVNTKYPATVVDVMNFFVNDPDAGKILGTERGLPANTDIRTSVQNSLTDVNMKATVDFENAMQNKFGPAPAVPPNGQSAIRALLITEAEKVQFGQMSSADAAKEFMQQAALKLTS
jgi:pectin-derived oligosaccharide transport system substrate-binding protein